MNQESWKRLREMFDLARELPPEDRGAWIERALADNPELRSRLVSLLAAEDEAGEFLSGATESRRTRSDLPEDLGSSIGPYRLTDVLGEGGFGVVYLAEQTRPIQRQVALKVIRLGMDTKQVIARFDAERQALALMDHPNIAQVFDAGETGSGRPYFVMEYFPGIPITDFCDGERLRIRDRLALFLQVCDAVQHAHQKGVIHRDLKPSNVLVSRRDGVPVAKVIDFGVVKATHQTLADRTFETREGVLVGTLGYMSPEQTASEGATVDTRTDIYSLGVLLYEMLVGEPPFDHERLRKAALLDVLRMIREEDPPRLPTRLVSMRDSAEEVALRRGMDGRSLARHLRGELDWITLRAMEKDPERRYASASELSADIRRHLVNEPVSAGPPSSIYRLRKFARRHRAGVGAAAAVLFAIVLGAAATGVGFERARRAERDARREADSARRVADFMVDMFDTATPDRSLGETITARTLLDEGARRVDTGLKRDPVVRARMLATLGRANLNLGLFDEGISLLRGALAVHEAALPHVDPTIGSDLSDLANALRVAGKLDEAGPMIDRSISILSRPGAPRSDALPVALYRKGEWLESEGRLKAADSLVTGAIRMLESTAGRDTADLVNMYNLNGAVEDRMGNPRGAEEALLRAIDLAVASGGEEQTSVVLLHRNLAAHYVHTHEPEKATPHAQEAERIARKIFPPDHPYIAAVLGARADILQYQGRLDEAVAIREEALRMLKKSFGPVHPKVAGELNTLGGLYESAGKLDLAIARMREACDMKRELYGEDNDQTAESVANLARFYQYAGEIERADSSYQKAIPVLERKARARPGYIAYAEMGYANLCRDRGRLTQADTLYTRAEGLLDTTQVALRGYFGECLGDHALLRSMEGRGADAEVMAQAAAHIEDGSGEEKYLRSALLQWAVIRARAGNANGAIALLRQAIDRGATEDEVSDYAELARLRGHAGYPAPASPADGARRREGRP